MNLEKTIEYYVPLSYQNYHKLITFLSIHRTPKKHVCTKRNLIAEGKKGFWFKHRQAFLHIFDAWILKTTWIAMSDEVSEFTNCQNVSYTSFSPQAILKVR